MKDRALFNKLYKVFMTTLNICKTKESLANKSVLFSFKMVSLNSSKTKKDDFSIREKILSSSSTNKWIRKKEKANVNFKTELTSFLTVSTPFKEKAYPKVSRATVISLPIFKKISL